MATTVIIEDHPLVAESIAAKVAGTLSGECIIAHSIDELKMTPAEFSQVGLWIVDLELGKTSAWNFIEMIRADFPASEVLVYTMHDSHWIGTRIRKAGVRLAVSKADPVSELDAALCAFHDGECYYSLSFADRDYFSPTFTPRELDVLRLITGGMSTSQAAQSLGVTENTVLTYRKNLMEKFGVHKLSDLITLSRGLL